MSHWLKSSLNKKFLISYALILASTILVVGFVLSHVVKSFLVKNLTHNLAVQARIIATPYILDPGALKDTAKLQERLKELEGVTTARLTLIAPDGVVKGDSEVRTEDLGRLDNHGQRPEVRAALNGEVGMSIRTSHTLNNELLYVGVPINMGMEKGGVLRLALPLTKVNANINTLRKKILISASLIIIGALLIILLMSLATSNPIVRLNELARQMAGGDLKVQVQGLPDNEIGEVGRNLNQLASRMKSTLRELDDEKAQLSTVLANMAEAVVAVNEKQLIIAANKTFSSLFGLTGTGFLNRPWVEVARNSEIEKLMGTAFQARLPQFSEIELLHPIEGIFEAHAVPVIQNNAVRNVLLVLHDVTRVRKLEQVRKDFVANVSHELRTPLAAIKGFAETLRLGGMDDKVHRVEFIQDIERHVDRMTRLVEDLLELSAIESKSRPPAFAKINLGEMAKELVHALTPLAKERKVTLRIEGPGENVLIDADRNQMRQVLTNLIENAIKFNKENGSVILTIDKSEDRAQMTLRDTGIGIPLADIPRIFERFYRVDKARSREVGGTGLGLSIVRHIVEAHNGDITVESQEGKGSEFKVSLPLLQKTA